MGEELTSSPVDISKIFEEHFPYYLAFGMTYDQFWRDDPKLVKAYRKAHELKKEWANQDAWLQGMYFYEALCDVSPVLHAFAKPGTRPIQYPQRPYGTETEEKELAQKRGKAAMMQFMTKFNKFRKEARQDEHRPA